jgi:hypothetical protein
MNPEAAQASPPSRRLPYLNEICDNRSSLLAAMVGVKLRRFGNARITYHVEHRNIGNDIPYHTEHLLHSLARSSPIAPVAFSIKLSTFGSLKSSARPFE